MSFDVQASPHFRVLAVDMRRFLAELLHFACCRISGNGDVACRVQIDADPVLDLAQRRLVDRHGDECELVIELDLFDLVEWRKVTNIQLHL